MIIFAQVFSFGIRIFEHITCFFFLSYRRLHFLKDFKLLKCWNLRLWRHLESDCILYYDMNRGGELRLQVVCLCTHLTRTDVLASFHCRCDMARATGEEGHLEELSRSSWPVRLGEVEVEAPLAQAHCLSR